MGFGEKRRYFTVHWEKNESGVSAVLATTFKEALEEFKANRSRYVEYGEVTESSLVIKDFYSCIADAAEEYKANRSQGEGGTEDDEDEDNPYECEYGYSVYDTDCGAGEGG